MTLEDQLNQSIDRIQDICTVDFYGDGPRQRTEVWFVLCDLLAAVADSPVHQVHPGVRPLDKADLRPPIVSVRRGGRTMRFLILPDDFTVNP